MYVITNRKLNHKETGLDVFGKEPNPSGPNELNLVSVSGASNSKVEPLADKPLSKTELNKLQQKYDFTIDTGKDWYPSLRVACEVFAKAKKENKDILFFVHGYNNDMADVLKTAKTLEKLYNLVVVPFSWPANGGGKLSGTAAYLSDKDDARGSATALNRTLQKIHYYHQLLTESTRLRVKSLSVKKFPDNSEKARMWYIKELDKLCKVRVSLLCHSMGNYVFKHASLPSSTSAHQLIFDNIALVAADVNNPGHDSWVEKLSTRNRLYVVINENDGALKWSRRKPGEEQLARLGHHLKNLSAANAYYLDVTRGKGVGKEHSYFKGKPVTENGKLKLMFARVFSGEIAETSLQYFPDLNLYR